MSIDVRDLCDPIDGHRDLEFFEECGLLKVLSFCCCLLQSAPEEFVCVRAGDKGKCIMNE